MPEMAMADGDMMMMDAAVPAPMMAAAGGNVARGEVEN